MRVYCTYQDPDYESPWQSMAPRSSSGSGVVIGARRVLTGAHVVANATFLQVQRVQDPGKATARVLCVNHDADLALLEVEDEEFLRGTVPARIGDLPSLRDEVAVVGFPVGGEELSITEGVVSRIEVQRYEHSQRYLLAVTVDAAINDGNSGGPVFAAGKVVGIAFQSLPEAENIGEMVPAPLIRCFLEGVRLGKEPVVPGLGIATQNLENPQLRAWLSMRPSDSGVLVTAVQHGSTAQDRIRARDVLTELDGHRIANNGTIQYRGRFRCHYDALLGEHFVGDRIEARVLRDGKKSRVSMPMRPMPFLVPRCGFDRPVGYFVWGGLVFQRLTGDYLRNWGDQWWDKAPKELLHLYQTGLRTEQRQEVVTLTHVLADEINVGYENLVNETVASVDGVAPRDLSHLIAMLDPARGHVHIETGSGACVVLDAAKARKANRRILRRYRVPMDRSPDLC
ncbi:MAG: S1C family serine protease [Planctomycetota bacterium]